jgi:hypothetical protein
MNAAASMATAAVAGADTLFSSSLLGGCAITTGQGAERDVTNSSLARPWERFAAGDEHQR